MYLISASTGLGPCNRVHPKIEISIVTHHTEQGTGRVCSGGVGIESAQNHQCTLYSSQDMPTFVTPKCA